MKKVLFWSFTVGLIMSLTLFSVSCKPAAVTEAIEEAVEEAVEEVEEAVEEAAEEVEEAVEEAVGKSFWEAIQAGDLNFDGIEINYLYQGGVGYDDYVAYLTEEFKNLTGATVISDPTPWEAQMPKIVNDVTTGANRYDVFEGDIEFQYGLYSAMEDITPYIDKFNVDMEGFFEPMYTFGEWSGLGRFGLPFSTGMGNFVIRTDVFDDAGITYPFDSFEDYYAALAEVQDPANGFYGTSFAGVNAQLVKMTLARLWGQGAPIYSKSWQPQINTPEGIKAYELMGELIDYAPPGILGWDIPESAAAFLNGDVASYENWWFALSGIIDNPDESDVAGQWAVIPAPGGGPSGNFVQHNLDLFKASENKDAAFAWIAFVCAAENAVYWAGQEINEGAVGFDYARKAAWEEVLLPALPAREGYFIGLDAGIPVTPGLPQWLEAFMAIGEHAGLTMSGEMTAEEAAGGLQTTLEGIIQQAIPPFEYVSPFAN